MTTSLDLDNTCVPFNRKKTYLALTIPLLFLMFVVGVFLFFIHPFLSIIYTAFWIGANFFQSYCCAYQECPYTDGFCPAVAGIIPASRIANLRLIRKMKKSKRRFEIFATFGSLCLVGLIVFPLIFLNGEDVLYSVGYIIFISVYAGLFLWNVCPVCAIRSTCPGGRFSTSLRKLRSS